MQTFTKRKFLEQPKNRQHKKSAELLRVIFEDPKEQNLSLYNQLQDWMELSPLPRATPQTISDHYHHHLKEAHVHLREHRLLPSIKKGDREIGSPPFPIAIYLDNIRSAHNVGSIVRTTEAFSLGTLYFSKATPSLNHKQVQDTSMGAHRLVATDTAPLDELPRPLIALETSPDAIPLADFLFPERFTLVIGNEEYGLSDETLSRADYLVEIPLRGRKNSLNVANAFAIAAAEIARQKEVHHDT